MSQTEDKALPSTDKTETDAVKDPENVNGQDPERKQSQLQYTYTLWFNRRVQGARTQENYEKNIKKIGSFSTVQDFWDFYVHLVRPNDLPNTSDYHLFKDGIKPMWEDGANRLGGKWIVRLPKGLASRYWEDLVLGVIGEQFEVGDEICGAVISIRYQEDIISLWTRNATDAEVRAKILETMKRILPLDDTRITVQYKNHDASIRDNSSFRNTEPMPLSYMGRRDRFGERHERGERGERGEREGRDNFRDERGFRERGDRLDRSSDRLDRSSDRLDRSSDRLDRSSDRLERGERGERGERAERGERGERPERGDRGDRGFERSERGERGERSERTERMERGERGERAERGDREPREDSRGLKSSRGLEKDGLNKDKEDTKDKDSKELRDKKYSTVDKLAERRPFPKKVRTPIQQPQTK